MKSRFFRRGLLALVAMGALFYFLFFSEFFQVEKVVVLRYTQDNPEPVEWVVTGEEKVSQEDIKALIPKKNIFLTDLRKIREDILEKFPQIAELEIHRSFPDIIDVAIIERVAVALWCEGEKCFLADRQGVPFEEALAETGLIRVFGKKELLGGISKILEIKSKLKEDLDIEIEKASLVSSKRLDVETSEGWEIYFNLEGDWQWQIQKLDLVLEKQIPLEERGSLEYVDLRFGKIYYK